VLQLQHIASITSCHHICVHSTSSRRGRIYLSSTHASFFLSHCHAMSGGSSHCIPLASNRHLRALVDMMVTQRWSRFCYICLHVPMYVSPSLFTVGKNAWLLVKCS
jgi:hypothetical protein